jgi:hypothetical protein
VRRHTLPSLSFALLVLSSCAARGPAAPSRPPWSKSLIVSSALGAPRGWQIARGTIHFHSPYSHDACDYWWHAPGGAARPASDIGDEPWARCLSQMREAICSVGHDFIFITDHPANAADFSLEQLLHLTPGDEPVLENGKVIANRVTCAGGRRPLLLAGTEGGVMALGLRAHVPGSADERAKIYSSDDAAGAVRAAGALAFVAHTESRDLASLEAKRPDGIEIYNLHANVDPKIRGPYLGMDPYGAVGDMLAFSSPTPSDDTPEPDLSFLAFLAPNGSALQKWDALLSTQDMPGVAGTDVHENTFSNIFADGERGDSYRRLLRWISNNVLIHDTSASSVREAVAAGRLYAAFDVFGSPVGFDFIAVDASGVTEMGGHARLSAHPKLVSRRPVAGGVALDPPPLLHTRLLHSSPSGAVEVAAGDGDLDFTPTEPGAYRIEVTVEPRHLQPYLGRVASLYEGRVYPWIYSNAIHVDP